MKWLQLLLQEAIIISYYRGCSCYYIMATHAIKIRLSTALATVTDVKLWFLSCALVGIKCSMVIACIYIVLAKRIIVTLSKKRLIYIVYGTQECHS